MSGKFTVSGTSTTITFAYTALTAQVQSIVGGCAEYLWDHGYGDHGTQEIPILFASLTNQQKLDLVDEHLKRVVLDAANTQKSIRAQEVARTTEESSKYTL
jgi:hypothetical protein